MPYPSVLTNLPNPTPSDRLNSPSHSSLHASVNGALTEIETFVGTDASVVGTLVYDIRSPNSDGGGHVQTANKGGTGQTSFTKGDLLVATSSSVIAKLAVSSTFGEVLAADPSQAAGVRWLGVTGTKVGIQTGSVWVSNSNAETVVFATSVLGSTFGTSNGIRFNVPLAEVAFNSGHTLTLRAKYGLNTVLTVTTAAAPANLTSFIGVFDGMIVSGGTTTTQKGFGELKIGFPQFKSPAANSVLGGMNYGTASITSNADQNFIVTAQYSAAEVTSYLNVPFGEADRIT